jgi:hypothetical protein
MYTPSLLLPGLPVGATQCVSSEQLHFPDSMVFVGAGLKEGEVRAPVHVG